MDEKSWLSDCCVTFIGRVQVTAKLRPSGRQEICDFLFFKLYLLSMRYPVEPLQVLWQPVTLSTIPIMMERSRAVLHCWLRDEGGRDCCCMRVIVGLSVKGCVRNNTRGKILH